jgi:hypothetical protein
MTTALKSGIQSEQMKLAKKLLAAIDGAACLVLLYCAYICAGVLMWSAWSAVGVILRKLLKDIHWAWEVSGWTERIIVISAFCWLILRIASSYIRHKLKKAESATI